MNLGNLVRAGFNAFVMRGRDPRSRLEKLRQDATERSLTSAEVSVLMGVAVYDERLYPYKSPFLNDLFQRNMTEEEAGRLLQIRRRDGKPSYTPSDLERSYPVLLSSGKTVWEKRGYFPLNQEQAGMLYGERRAQKYRPATWEEACRLYNDLHSKLVRG